MTRVTLALAAVCNCLISHAVMSSSVIELCLEEELEVSILESSIPQNRPATCERREARCPWQSHGCLLT